MKRKIFMACAAVVALVWSCTPKSEILYEYCAPEFKNTYKAEIVPLNKSVICSMCSFLEICDDKLILG
ncbi:MAG: hypothetical protein IKA38_05590, partial [Alistipes sp.]|nr:hypothetical protein [Alistipes sp.]